MDFESVLGNRIGRELNRSENLYQKVIDAGPISGQSPNPELVYGAKVDFTIAGNFDPRNAANISAYMMGVKFSNMKFEQYVHQFTDKQPKYEIIVSGIKND